MAEFLRLLAHDVRNDLNAVDLLTAYIRDIAAEPGVRGELDQLRTAIRYGSERMQRLSRAFQTPEPEKFFIPVSVLTGDFQERFRNANREVFARVHWADTAVVESLCVDVDLMMEVFSELLENAAAFSRPDSDLFFGVRKMDGGVVFVVGQPAEEVFTDCESWGKRPFVTSRRGHYGLGLFRVRRLLEAHGAQLRFVPSRTHRALEARVEFIATGGGDEA
jgi:signal transduction histidine kinase